jgi:hypothetical protein
VGGFSLVGVDSVCLFELGLGLLMMKKRRKAVGNTWRGRA